ncbi:MAG: M6 family metalloprotease domain-containing protein [Bacteroidaceae bacterium]|nr:M6 family metalloprotease domain-containing protein [Bacteroidaceae bacterium]
MNNRKNIFYIFIVSLLYSFDVFAIPAWPGVHQFRKSDGTLFRYKLVGDENFHVMQSLDDGCFYVFGPDSSIVEITSDQYTNGRKEARGRVCNNASQRRSSSLSIGKKRGLVVLVEFADVAFNEKYTNEVFDGLMNEDGYNQYGATGSAGQFFRDQSLGVFDPQFDIVGPVTLSHDAKYYGENVSLGFVSQDGKPEQMVIEACKLVDEKCGVDFSQYDNDNDGSVDFVYFIYAGYGENYTSNSEHIWPHQSYIENFGYSLELDGKKINRYACSCELKYAAGDQLEGIGTFCHEFSHVLGLADLYNTESSASCVSVWSIMESGCYNNESRTPCGYSAHEMSLLGWLEFTELEEAKLGYELPELSGSHKAFRVSTRNENEFFVLENRQQKGWDAYMPCTGMMITHIDYDEASWSNNTLNNDSSHPRYHVVAADGTWASTHEGDLFPGSTGNTSFTDTTYPNSLTWDGEETGKAITGIREVDDMVLFDFQQKKLSTPIVYDAEDVTSSSFVVTWDAVENAQSYTLTVVEDLPDDENPLLLNENFNKMNIGDYPEADVNDISSSLGDYMNCEGWRGNDVYQCGGMCRVGCYGVSGALISPAINLSNADKYTLAFRACAFTGKSANMYVVLYDSVAESQVAKFSYKVKTAEQYFRIPIDAISDRVSVSFLSNHERVYIDDLKLIVGDADSLTIANADAPKYVFFGITDNRYEVTGMNSSHTFHYYLQAIIGDAIFDSDLSDTLSVTLMDDATFITPQMSVLKDDVRDYNTNVAVYNLNGERVKLDCLEKSGVYILRRNNRIRKIVVR